MKVNNFDVKAVETLDDIKRFLSNTIGQIVTVINGKIGLNDNLDATLVSVGFSTAGTDTAVTHNLGRQAIGYIMTSSSGPTMVYAGQTASNNNTLFLRASAPASVTLLVF